MVKKTQNLKNKPSVYFSKDDKNLPYKRVKGGGVATIIEDPSRTVTQGDRISLKYLGTLDYPIVKMITDRAKNEVALNEVRSYFLYGIIVKWSHDLLWLILLLDQ